MNAQWQNPRRITERILIQGELVLETPTHLGNGDADGPLDMPLNRDELKGHALLTGTSIAGALRNYAGQVISPAAAARLFGRVTEDESEQSWLIVEDARGSLPVVELRDGVKIDPATRTADDKKKFDIELLSAGMTFPLAFELPVPANGGAELIQTLAVALKGLEEGKISLGKRKARGYGRCRVDGWRLTRWDMRTPAGLVEWLEGKPGKDPTDKIELLLDLKLDDFDEPLACELEGTFKIHSSLLIRSGAGQQGQVDVVHLKTRRNGSEVPVLSGTSLAGALRGRAMRIANTLNKDGKAVANALFGYLPDKDHSGEPLQASRVWVEESIIERPQEMVQSRLKIDRLTGGAYPGALFQEQPVFGAGSAQVKVKLRIRKASSADVGLILLLLKDLWTGDLPLGGESGVGRGRLRGIDATLRYQGACWKLSEQGEILEIVQSQGPQKKLQDFVDAFVKG
ncbi:MAG: hypothetical protein GYA17_00775 [Chloroflexi bacterium]|nr:hypothetical protein [Chloroflexota bacterium]